MCLLWGKIKKIGRVSDYTTKGWEGEAGRMRLTTTRSYTTANGYDVPTARVPEGRTPPTPPRPRPTKHTYYYHIHELYYYYYAGGHEFFA